MYLKSEIQIKGVNDRAINSADLVWVAPSTVRIRRYKITHGKNWQGKCVDWLNPSSRPHKNYIREYVLC